MCVAKRFAGCPRSCRVIGLEAEGASDDRRELRVHWCPRVVRNGQPGDRNADSAIFATWFWNKTVFHYELDCGRGRTPRPWSNQRQAVGCSAPRRPGELACSRPCSTSRTKAGTTPSSSGPSRTGPVSPATRSTATSDPATGSSRSPCVSGSSASSSSVAPTWLEGSTPAEQILSFNRHVWEVWERNPNMLETFVRAALAEGGSEDGLAARSVDRAHAAHGRRAPRCRSWLPRRCAHDHRALHALGDDLRRPRSASHRRRVPPARAHRATARRAPRHGGASPGRLGWQTPPTSNPVGEPVAGHRAEAGSR